MPHSAVTELDVARAVDVEIRTWRENMKHALQEVKYPKMEDKPFLKSCAWLGATKDPVRVFAGRSQANQVMTWLTSDAVKLAPPMYIASQAASAFDAINTAIVREQNRLLNIQYATIKDGWFSKIDDQARVFVSTAYGRSIIRQVMTYLQGQTFDDIDKSVYLRLLLKRSKFIETEYGVLRTNGIQAFSRLCETIFTIFQGTYHANAFFDNRKEIRLMSGEMHISNHRGTYERYDRVRSREWQDRMLAEAWKYSGRHVNRNAFFEKTHADISFVTENENAQPLRLPDNWKGPALSLQEGDRQARAAFAQRTGRTLN